MSASSGASELWSKTAERKLYLVLGDGTAIRYAVAVGWPGKQWQGQARVSGKYVQFAWTPPAGEVKADNPALPDVIPGGAPNTWGTWSRASQPSGATRCTNSDRDRFSDRRPSALRRRNVNHRCLRCSARSCSMWQRGRAP